MCVTGGRSFSGSVQPRLSPLSLPQGTQPGLTTLRIAGILGRSQHITGAGKVKGQAARSSQGHLSPLSLPQGTQPGLTTHRTAGISGRSRHTTDAGKVKGQAARASQSVGKVRLQGLRLGPCNLELLTKPKAWVEFKRYGKLAYNCGTE